MTAVIKTHEVTMGANRQLEAARVSAEEVLRKWEAKSPELKALLAGHMRGIIGDLMGMTFLDGVKWATEETLAHIERQQVETCQ